MKNRSDEQFHAARETAEPFTVFLRSKTSCNPR